VEARYCRVVVVRPEAPALTVERYKNLPETGPQYQPIEGGFYVAPAPNRLRESEACASPLLPGLPINYQRFSSNSPVLPVHFIKPARRFLGILS
jgi:hypothetical protein